jgi:hypothetical protein
LRGFRLLDALPEDGERRLMLAVLMDAIRIVRKHHAGGIPSRRRRAWQRERGWIEADDCSTPFSFVSICEVLGLDASYVRRWALRTPVESETRRRIPLPVYWQRRWRHCS